MERIEIIDSLKGYAIVLVVIGHVITYANPNNFIKSWLFSFIYAFHMPLFLFLSGYLVYQYFPRIKRIFVYKKIRGLLYPYFIWLSIFTIVANNLVFDGNILNYFWSIIRAYSLWFLPVLFISFIFLAGYIVIEQCLVSKKGEIVAPIIFFILYIIAWNIPLTSSVLLITRWFSPFVLLGYFVSKNWTWITERRYFISILILIFILLLPSWYGYSISFVVSNKLNLVVDFILAISGIGFAYYLLYSLKETKIFGFLSYCGVYSLEIYILSAFMALLFTIWHIQFWIGSGLTAYITGSAVLLSFSLFGSVILAHYRIVSILLFGRWSAIKF